MNKEKQLTIDSPVLVVVGPTAIGKTALSLELAEKFLCEIVSVDSMQVYRYMDIGTAKPSADEISRVPHHLIDIVDPDEQFDASRFVHHAIHAINLIVSSGKIPLMTGGTGMYLKALFNGLFDFEITPDKTVREELKLRLENEGNVKLYHYLEEVDPKTAGRIHPNDTQRLLRALEIYTVSGKSWSELLNRQSNPPVKFKKLLQIGLSCKRQFLYKRIEKRSNQMIDMGLIEEVEGLRKMGYSPKLASMQSIGYKHANNYIDGAWSLVETLRLLKRDTRRYAKRQLTWFGSDQNIRWYDRNATEEIVKVTDEWLND